ncbi:MAG: sigma-54-dependent transcriptional regulator [Chloroflexota bacterium]
MQSVLIVEDKESMAEMLARTFDLAGFRVRTAGRTAEALGHLVAGGIDVVITDLKLPDGSGMDVLSMVRERWPLIPVVVMTAYGSIELAVRAVKAGACDFITKPFDPDHLVHIARRALSERNAGRENLLMKSEFSNLLTMPEMIGVSGKWRDVTEKVKRVAMLKTTVLILGESGTGKELVARAVHHLSPRSGQPFVALNCAAIPAELMESELFGHEKGAFTSAHDVKPGKFELSDGGTVFLDEIGDMAMPLQSKLLRVLQESEFERVGGTKTIRVDLRVVAASNKDLEGEVAGGRFREDLFYRLNVFPVVIPPLRERREDILPLSRHFLEQLPGAAGRAMPVLTPEAERMLLEYDWKGNVRELRNVIERATILCDGGVLGTEHLHLSAAPPVTSPQASAPDAPLHDVAESAARAAERARIEDVLRRTGGNKSRAAGILKVSYKTLLTKIKEYRISLSP